MGRWTVGSRSWIDTMSAGIILSIVANRIALPTATVTAKGGLLIVFLKASIVWSSYSTHLHGRNSVRSSNKERVSGVSGVDMPLRFLFEMTGNDLGYGVVVRGSRISEKTSVYCCCCEKSGNLDVRRCLKNRRGSWDRVEFVRSWGRPLL